MHSAVKIVELKGQYFWKCGCGASSDRGFPRDTAATLNSRETRCYGSE